MNKYINTSNLTQITFIYLMCDSICDLLIYLLYYIYIVTVM